MCRDVDNSRKPGKSPGCERDFSGCKALLLSPKCFSMLSEDCYIFILFVYTFTAVLPEVKVLYVNTLFSAMIASFALHRPFCRLNGQRYFVLHVCKIMNTKFLISLFDL